LAVAQQNSGFTESAIATYEELLKIDPDNLNASLNMLGLLNQRYPAVAYRRLKELWSENTQNAGIAAQIGLTSASMGNIEEATRFLEIASTLEPGNATHYYNMAVISDRAGNYKGAVDYYQKALEIDITYGGGHTIPRDEVYDRLAHLRRL
jgi:tetratricopeptide (TPR) repeat protein